MKNFIGLWAALLMLSACGKSLQLAAKPGPNGAPAASSARDGQTNTNTSTSTATTTATGTSTGVDTSTSTGTSNSTDTQAALDPTNLKDQVDGQLTQISKYDASELKDSLPYLNTDEGDNAIRSIGAPADSNPLGYVRASNMVFRAVKHLPDPKEIIRVVEFSLRLKGLRRYSEKETEGATMNGQSLCLIEAKQCSGDKPVAVDANANAAFWDKIEVRSHVFADLKLNQMQLANGQMISTIMPRGNLAEGEVVLDLRKVFGLEDLNDEQLAAWIYTNSVEYTENGYRKFRFVIANNTFFDKGELNIQVETKSTSVTEVPDQVVKGSDDTEAMNLKPGHLEKTAAAVKKSGDEAGDYDLNLQGGGDEAKLEFTGSNLKGTTSQKNAKLTKLDKTAAAIAAYSDKVSQIRVVAQSDKTGTAEANLAATAKRAKLVSDRLKGNGAITSVVADPVGLGSGESATPDARRVTIHIDFKSGLDSATRGELKAKLAKDLNAIW